jgi:hypothetical protein
MKANCTTLLIAALLGFSALTFSQDVPAAKEEVLSPVAGTETGTELSSHPVIIVREFSVNDKTSWPYDLKQLQTQTVAELKGNSKNRVDVLTDVPATARVHTYTIQGEIVSWRSGNAAKRWLVGAGTGRESADIRYWLTDETGKEVFEHKDTIRAEFWGNAYAGSVGQLAHPFASKIAARLTEAKVF